MSPDTLDHPIQVDGPYKLLYTALHEAHVNSQIHDRNAMQKQC
jgi:hypothetical protein